MAYEAALTALADPTRRAIFEALLAGPRPVAQLAEGRRVSRPAVSQHLKVLEAAGLVTATPRGTARIYAIRPAGLTPLREWLEGFWDAALASYAEEVSRQMEARNDRTDPQGD